MREQLARWCQRRTATSLGKPGSRGEKEEVTKSLLVRGQFGTAKPSSLTAGRFNYRFDFLSRHAALEHLMFQGGFQFRFADGRQIVGNCPENDTEDGYQKRKARYDQPRIFLQDFYHVFLLKIVQKTGVAS
jgi:hypothetical protein